MVIRRLIWLGPLLLAAPLLIAPMMAGEAAAQVGGSYRRSCGNIDQDGPTLSADCDAPGGRRIHSELDVSRCRGQAVANTFGRLTCGGRAGSADEAGGGFRGGYAEDDRSNYRRPRFRGPGYGPPPDDDDDYGPPRRRFLPPPPDDY